MSTNKFENVKVGDSLAVKSDSDWGCYPKIAHRIFGVTKRTTTQLVAKLDRAEIRVRTSDGKILGENYKYAEIATPELLAQNKAEREQRERFAVAARACGDLIGKELHQLKLSVAQLERLAEAWSEIKAMGPAADKN